MDDMEGVQPQAPHRRCPVLAEPSERTRDAIIAAARRLFAEQGYAQTKVEEIARLARVAPITVYSAAGGKIGLLRALMEIWSTASGNDIALVLFRVLGLLHATQ